MEDYESIFAAVEACKADRQNKEKFNLLVDELRRVEPHDVCLLTIATEFVNEIDLETVVELKRDIKSMCRRQHEHNKFLSDCESAGINAG